MSANAKTSGTGGLTAFDQLPPKLRAALREFPLNMSAEYALSAIRSGTSEAELLSLLETQRSSLGEFNPKA